MRRVEVYNALFILQSNGDGVISALVRDPGGLLIDSLCQRGRHNRIGFRRVPRQFHGGRRFLFRIGRQFRTALRLPARLFRRGRVVRRSLCFNWIFLYARRLPVVVQMGVAAFVYHQMPFHPEKPKRCKDHRRQKRDRYQLPQRASAVVTAVAPDLCHLMPPSLYFRRYALSCVFPPASAKGSRLFAARLFMALLYTRP